MPTEIPEFTQVAPGEASENAQDEAIILMDGDQTTRDPRARDEESDVTSALNSIENEPGDFIRGEVDVKQAMDRAARELNSSIRGLADEDDDGSPEDTPGGLEEIEQKILQEQALRRGRSH